MCCTVKYLLEEHTLPVPKTDQKEPPDPASVGRESLIVASFPFLPPLFLLVTSSTPFHASPNLRASKSQLELQLWTGLCLETMGLERQSRCVFKSPNVKDETMYLTFKILCKSPLSRLLSLAQLYRRLSERRALFCIDGCQTSACVRVARKTC